MVFPVPGDRNRLDVAWHPADREAGQGGDGGCSTVWTTTSCRTSTCIGPSLTARAAWATCRWSPGHKGIGDTISVRSEHTAKWTNWPCQGNGQEDGCGSPKLCSGIFVGRFLWSMSAK
jgi:hypothetical protein